MMRRKSAIDWSDYAEAYDLLLAINPAYQEIIEACLTWCKALQNSDAPILDVGAGTGNFTAAMASVLPKRTIIYFEPDPGMYRLGTTKLGQLTNVRPVQSSVSESSFPPESLSAIVCVHALYTFPDPLIQLNRMRSWLMPNGCLFLCDIGRAIQLWDWTTYLLRTVIRQFGLVEALRVLWDTSPARRANSGIRQRQLSGEFWLHTLGEIREAVESAGFRVETATQTYRGYSDLVIARSDANVPSPKEAS